MSWQAEDALWQQELHEYEEERDRQLKDALSYDDGPALGPSREGFWRWFHKNHSMEEDG